ncbi:MAG: hypothetical protein JSU63_19550 [Phycisphaerales bacterium]|nr:MAG: hypothetical protein JSU63_19550 [Phycisphaerales bacterium]
MLAHCFSIDPGGFILASVLKELPPIKAHSEESRFDVTQTGGVTQLLRDVLEKCMQLYRLKYGDLDARLAAARLVRLYETTGDSEKAPIYADLVIQTGADSQVSDEE